MVGEPRLCLCAREIPANTHYDSIYKVGTQRSMKTSLGEDHRLISMQIYWPVHGHYTAVETAFRRNIMQKLLQGSSGGSRPVVGPISN